MSGCVFTSLQSIEEVGVIFFNVRDLISGISLFGSKRKYECLLKGQRATQVMALVG